MSELEPEPEQNEPNWWRGWWWKGALVIVFMVGSTGGVAMDVVATVFAGILFIVFVLLFFAFVTWLFDTRPRKDP